MLISDSFLQFARRHFELDWEGIHGVRHWQRVCENGLLLAEQTGADPVVVELFAFIHDLEREADQNDPDHGVRGARLVPALVEEFFPEITRAQQTLLIHACRDHSRGLLVADTTIQTCWDADRLDLGRTGEKPWLGLLGTEAARQPPMINFAYLRSKR